MERTLLLTRDGSHTIRVTEGDLTYHSVHGAIAESMHVFIRSGLQHWLSGRESKGTSSSGIQPPPAVTTTVRILEMGFGTGLNALLTLREAEKLQCLIDYTTLEKYPLTSAELQGLNYAGLLADERSLHETDWEMTIDIGEHFRFRKHLADLVTWQPAEVYDLIYFDAFAPGAQPELWTPAIFRKLYDSMAPHGILVTYCSKGDVRRAMLTAGFQVEKISGPPHKREMLRAVR